MKHLTTPRASRRTVSKRPSLTRNGRERHHLKPVPNGTFGQERFFQALHEIAVAVGGVLDPVETARLVGDRAVELLGADTALLHLWDEQESVLRLLYIKDCVEAAPRPFIKPGEGVAGRAFQSRGPVVILDYPTWKHANADVVAKGLRGIMSVPLLVADRAIGALTVRYYEPHVCAPEYVQHLSLLAAQVGPALEAARLYSAAEKGRAEAEALAGLMREAATEPDADQVISLICKQACGLLGADYSGVTLLDGEGSWTWRGVHGTRHRGWRSWRKARLGRGTGLSSRALASGRTVIAEGLPDNPQSSSRFHDREGGKTALATPLMSRQGTLGALVVGWRTDVKPSAAQVSLAEALAYHAATVLEAALSRSRVEQTLHDLATSEERIRGLYEAIGCAVFLQDSDGRIVQANSATRRVLGFSPEEILGRRPNELWHAYSEDGRKLPPAERPSVQALRTGREQRDVVLRVIRPDQEPRWLQAHAVPIPGQDGRPAQVVSSFIDITERMRVEEALRESEARFRTVFESAAIAMARTDLNGRLVETNRAFQQMLGYSAKELRDKAFADFTHPDDLGDNVRLRQEMVEGKRDNIQIEKRCYRKDGSLIWVMVTASLVRGASGEPLFSIAMLQDITARKEAEGQLQALAQAEKMRAIGQMASGVAHDLNQYLALVAGHGDLVLQALDAEPIDRSTVRDSVHTIVQAAMDGGGSVRRLLTFARSNVDSEMEILDCAELLREVANLTAPSWRDAAQEQGRPISLHVEASGEAFIQGWPASLREALTNLVFNGVEALPNGGAIRLSAHRRGEQVRIEVADTGVGMTAEVQSHLFEPFFSTKGDKGTGLGLAMVYTIVERHGGKIDFASTPGRGTTFCLTFPAASRAPSRAAMSADPEQGRPLRVLAVDDEPGLGRMVALMLEQHGHQVVVATSGEEALERLEADPYDLIISDVGMGAGMNGWELAQQVKQRWPTTRFALATGWGAQIDPAEARARGVEAVVSKPYRTADLQRLLVPAS
jgi:PAS domain S-box-containing protein